MDQPDASWKYPPPPAQAGPAGRPAAWWKRAVAYFLDGLVIGAPAAVFGIMTGLAQFVRDGDQVRFEAEPALLLLSAVATVLYSAVMDGGPRQASVGKMALKIRVGDADSGAPIGFGRAASRRLMYLGLFYAIVLPGVVNALWPLFDVRRQAWHDKAVRSVVVEVT